MAKRPIFIPKISGSLLVVEMPIEFDWHSGMSKSQKQKSIRSLHDSAKQSRGIERILEISSKSEGQLGVRLSAFNLMLKTSNGLNASVEVLFQGSKVFSRGGPFTDIYRKSSMEAKKDERLRESGHLIAFRYEDRDWKLNPQTAFYDWLYLSALRQNPKLAEELLEYDGYSDIEFNPKKSINCQAASAALYKSLVGRELIDIALSSPNEFIKIREEQKKKPVPIQGQFILNGLNENDMPTTHILKLQAGHLYVSIDSHDWLLDTGMPTTFGNIESLCIERVEFDIPDSYMGLNAAQLSEFVGHSTAGIIGADILKKFNMLIDMKNEQATFAIDKIVLTGNTMEIEEFIGIPIVLAKIGGTNRRMFFDTGAQISYFQDESLNTFPSAGAVTDFFPGVGQFQTETYMVDVTIGTEQHKLRCGSLPELLGMTLTIAGVEGIIGNEILNNRVVGYFPNHNQLVLA